VGIAALMAALLGAACGEESTTPDGGGGNGPLDKPHSTGGSSWTVLVYMVADNDLEPFALADLDEMMQAGSSSGFNLVVQVDRADGYTSDGIGGLPDFTGVKRLKVNAGSLQELQDLGELDSADPATLSSFVTWGLQNYPADRTALVLWDHGGGWHGFGVDEASGNRLMHLPEIEQGVAQGLAGANAKPLALIGFDACLMATWEVAATLSPHAEYLLASEETEPGHGWDWSAFSLAANSPDTDPVTLGKHVMAGFFAQAQQQNTVDNVTLALIDLYRLGSLHDAMTGMTKTFDGSQALVTAFGRGQERSLKFGDAPDPSRATNLVDLGTLAEETSKEASQVQAGAIQTAISGAVVAHVEGAAKASAKGIAVYFPPSASVYDTGYDAITAASAWRSFLQTYFGGASSEGSVPTFTNANKLAVTSFDSSGHLAVGGTLDSSTASSVVSATLYEGLVVNNSYVLLSEEPASVSGTAVSGTWDLSVLQISRGSATGFGYAAFDLSMPNRIELDVLFAYRKSASTTDPQTCIRQIVFDTLGASPTITSDSYFVSNNGAFGELSPIAGSTLMPIVKTIDPNTGDVGMMEGATTAFPATVDGTGKATFDDLKLEFVKVNPQVDVVVVMTAQNAAGKGDAVLATEKTP
jgi:hypothetical protein